MNFKKLISLLLCMCVLLGLTACVAHTADPDVLPLSSEGNESTETQDTSVGVEPITVTTDAESYSVTVDDMVPIIVTVNGGNGEVALGFESADESVATVNKYGKIIGVGAGTTTVTVTANGETVATLPVTVEGVVYENVLKVALNVLYNDTELGCANTEYGPYVEVKEDGQYTVSFDCTTDLSESSRKMGVTELKNLTAIFLYDHAVRVGDQKTSSVTACEIRWDSICVNDTELTLNGSDFKSAIKASGIFDTNDPLNAWDGSAVEEVTTDTDAHVLNINVEQPTTISITFTISGLTFAE